MHDTIDAELPTRRRRAGRSDPGTSPPRARDRRGARLAAGAPARGRLSGAASSTATRRSRAIRSCSRRSWAAWDSEKSARLARTIRDEALPGGGWSQYPGGPADLSVSCLSYFALKVAGDDAERAAHARAREVDPVGGRRGSGKHLHAVPPGDVRAVPAGARLPAIPPEMIFLPGARAVQRLRHVELVADDLRPAVDPVGEASRCARCPHARGARRAVSRRARQRSGARAAHGLGRVLLRASTARSRSANACPAPPRCASARSPARPPG